MRLILSRKGFDASAGGVASPIFDDGTMISLPIPSQARSITYGDLTVRGRAIGELVAELTGDRRRVRHGVHHDPDLEASARPRRAGWRPMFGQADNAQTVLARAGVGAGDLFLFFGWFRRVERAGVRWRFVPRAPDLHVVWGWLEVEQVWSLPKADAPAWARDHPHFRDGAHLANNTIYVGRGGVMERFRPEVQLTKPGATRSVWRLPRWFAPGARPPLGHHDDRARWTPAGDSVELRTVGRGQEFVLDTAHYPEAEAWARDLIRVGTAR